VEFTVDQGGVKQPLAKQVEDAVDLGAGGGRQGPRLPAGLVGAGQQRGGGGLLLLLLLLGAFGWLTPTALRGGGGQIERERAGEGEGGGGGGGGREGESEREREREGSGMRRGLIRQNGDGK